MRVRAVVFDVGETLVDETRMWHAWADRLGVPRHTFSAVFGEVLAAGRDHRAVFEAVRPGFDPSAGEGPPWSVVAADLYPDARPCLAALRAAGLVVGIVGNQPARSEALLRALDLPVDLVATSEGWGVAKPAAAFFTRLAAEVALPPAEILYVGDRLDNDIRPAAAAGLRTAFLRRGPWGHLHAEAARPVADLVLERLADLPPQVAGPA